MYVVAHPGAELFGSDRMLLESVQGLVDSGARVLVALPERGPLVEALRRRGAGVVILPMLVLRKSLMRPVMWGKLVRDSLHGAGAAWRLLRRQRPSALYISTITIPQWPLVAAALRIPTVSHVHEAEASGRRLLNAVLYAPHLLSRTLLVNSEFSWATLSAALPPAARRARVVYNGVAGPGQATSPRKELDVLRILYIGRLSPRKGVDVIIDSASRLQRAGVPVEVSLLGSAFAGYEWYEAELRERAIARESPRVDFLGFRRDIWPVLDRHDVLVVPSRVDEPFGNTAVEGVLAERPVIASDTSGLREAAGGYPTSQLVKAGDADALAGALTQVVENWERIRAHVAESREIAQDRHALDRYRAAVVDAVSHAASSGVPSDQGKNAPTDFEPRAAPIASAMSFGTTFPSGGAVEGASANRPDASVTG